MSETITRRRAIGAGTLAAIAAGLLGVNPTEAATPANPTVAPVGVYGAGFRDFSGFAGV
jgi:hypothetical protein